MTFYEKLQQEHPKCIHANYTAGVKGCPCNYQYENCDAGLCRGMGYNNETECVECWNREMPENSNVTLLPYKPGEVAYGTIKDSGERRKFATGAVRDMQEGKGRCDLMPLRVIAKCWRFADEDDLLDESEARAFEHIADFQDTGDTTYLLHALNYFPGYKSWQDMFLEVAKHFEEGAKKYGENNWQKGLPANCYIDSAIRHYLKWLRGDKDEPHDRAFVWNLMCCIWEVDYSPRAKEMAE